MTDDQIHNRMRAIIAEEQRQPLVWWWLSFAGEEGFRGACIVRARGFLGAVQRAHALEINPGGEVRSTEIPGWTPTDEEATWTNRLLTLADIEAMPGGAVKWSDVDEEGT